MKKIAIAIIIILFLGSVYVGFRAADQMNAKILSTNNNGDLDSTSTQKNYLFIHVSTLTGDSPFLIAVWGLFINNAESPHLAFVPLYPTETDNSNSNLSRAFTIRKDLTIPNRFISNLEHEYGIETNGYFILDNLAVSSLRAWTNQESASVPQSVPQSEQDRQMVLTSGQQFFSSLCGNFQRVGISPVLDEIQWSVLLPEHFTTSLTFEAATLLVDSLASAGELKFCDVLSSQ